MRRRPAGAQLDATVSELVGEVLVSRRFPLTTSSCAYSIRERVLLPVARRCSVRHRGVQRALFRGPGMKASDNHFRGFRRVET